MTKPSPAPHLGSKTQPNGPFIPAIYYAIAIAILFSGERRIPNVKIVKNPSLVVPHCTFTMY